MHRTLMTALLGIAFLATNPAPSRAQPAATAPAATPGQSTPAAKAPAKAHKKNQGKPRKRSAKAGAKPKEPATVRPAAVPLVLHTPYFSIWSPADRLTDAATVHWTGKPQPLTSMIRIDGQAYRLMGAEPGRTPALPQTNLRVLPTRTIYDFQNPQVRVQLTFTTPLLPYAVDMLAHPMTFLSWEVVAADGRQHEVQLYYDNQAELVVNKPEQQVVWGRQTIGDMTVLRMGSQEQPVLAKKGDDLRIDWGYLYVGSPSEEMPQAAVASADAARGAFLAGHALPTADDARMPRAAKDATPVIAFASAVFPVGKSPVTRHMLLAYDEIQSIEYFHQPLRPFWRRMDGAVSDLFEAAGRDYGQLRAHCLLFDEYLMADLEKAGGRKYAEICALCYRQCLAANGLAADARGMPLMFPKENFSNGCIGTVDVIFPQSPLLLLVSPTLVKATLLPILDYASSPRWKFPYAPHDLGTYPKANGQVYGGGERTDKNQMPVEESGNMLILVAALAQAEGDAGTARKYWPLLTRWAEFLKEKGLDPENQLCTDDFAGHLAHNANLSIKAIVALGAYARLCELTGHASGASAYRKLAEDYAARWIKMATEDDHTRLAFDKPGTWSQKYNLIWDRVLRLNLFPAEVARREVAYYLKMQNRFGLPLDQRKDYTKIDSSLWVASLAENRADFEALVAPVYAWIAATPDRVPQSDWYHTLVPKKQGFQARSVVGGVFVRMLLDSDIWARWSARGGKVLGDWAPLVTPPADAPQGKAGGK
jgi:hypothetical protein